MRGAFLAFTSTKKLPSSSCFETDDCQPAMTAADEFNVSTCPSSFIYVFCTKSTHFEMWAALRDACCCRGGACLAFGFGKRNTCKSLCSFQWLPIECVSRGERRMRNGYNTSMLAFHLQFSYDATEQTIGRTQFASGTKRPDTCSARTSPSSGEVCQ